MLCQRPEVDAARLGGIGFCFGGSIVLQLARSGVDLKGVDKRTWAAMRDFFQEKFGARAPIAPGKAPLPVCGRGQDEWSLLLSNHYRGTPARYGIYQRWTPRDVRSQYHWLDERATDLGWKAARLTS